MTKFAVLVGCRYPDRKGQVLGAHHDVKKMREVITTRLGFDGGNVKVIKDKSGSADATGAEIKNALVEMASKAKDGDVLFFYFAGHGGFDEGLQEEYIVAADHKKIYSHDFKDIISKVPDGATFTVLSDSCHSGGLLGDGDGGILLSACKPTETTTDVMAGGIYGAFSNAVVTCLTSKARATPITNGELVSDVKNMLKGASQHPSLYCADKYVDAVFLGSLKRKKSG